MMRVYFCPFLIGNPTSTQHLDLPLFYLYFHIVLYLASHNGPVYGFLTTMYSPGHSSWMPYMPLALPCIFPA